MTFTSLVIDAYRTLLCRRRLFRLNRALYSLALRGMGVLNHETDRLTGERAFLERFARLGGSPTVLDVGAHDGSYATAVARLVPRARIFAFEPHPETYARLVERAGGMCTPVRAAVSQQAGSATLYDRGRSAGSQHASVVPGVMEVIHKQATTESWTVPTLTLDDFIRDHGIARVHLLKIDTEGSELDVLRGARAAIAAGTVDIVQLEFNAMNTLSRAFMRDFRDVLPGYTVHRLLPDGPVCLDPYEPVFEEIFAFQNVVFVSTRLDPEARRILTA